MRLSVDEVNCSGTSTRLFSPRAARSRTRSNSQLDFPVPEGPNTSCSTAPLPFLFSLWQHRTLRPAAPRVAGPRAAAAAKNI